MTRKVITDGLSQLLRNALAEKRIPYAEEVSFAGHDKIRPDFVGVEVFYGGLANIGLIEQGKVSVFEIKSSVADYRSGAGLNQIGDYNYVVLPKDVHDKLIAKDMLKGYNGWHHVFPVPKGWRGDIENLPKYEGQVDGWRLRINQPVKSFGRTIPIAEVLWAMIYSRSGIRRSA